MAGERLISHVQPELEDKVRWQRLSREVLQCGSDNKWLGYLGVSPPSVFTYLRLLQLAQGSGWAAA